MICIDVGMQHMIANINEYMQQPKPVTKKQLKRQSNCKVKKKTCFPSKKKKILEQHLEHTPWWRSKEAFDFLNMKPWDKFNQQAVIHPSTRSPVTDLCKIVMGKPSTCRPLIQIITCFIIYQNSIPLKTTTKRCYFCTFSFLLVITRLTRDARRLD